MGGQVLTTQQPVASPALGTEERQLLKLACGSPQTLEQYPPYLGREQTPFVLPAPALPASVLKSIEALKLPAPQLSLQHLRLSFKDFNEANKQKILLTPTPRILMKTKRDGGQWDDRVVIPLICPTSRVHN